MSTKEKISLILGENININIKRVIILKSISIKISRNCIHINVPFLLPKKTLEKLIYKKKNWINKQLLIKSKTKLYKIKEYINNEIFLYLGKNYKLKIIISTLYSVDIVGDYLVVNLKNRLSIQKIKRVINQWFRERSAIYFKKQAYYLANKSNLEINSIKVKEYKSRWGSCSINGEITFNWRLIMAPPKIIEYVIIHELMHLKEHNHSQKYWKHVKSLYPNFNDAKEWLNI